MGILALCILGLFAGAIAKMLVPGRDPGGMIITMAIGVAGALGGGFVAREAFGSGLRSFFDLHTWACAVGGSVALLLLYRLVRRGR